MINKIIFLEKRKTQMPGEVEPLTRESTLEGQVAQETVGQTVAFPPQRGQGTHGSIRKCPGKRRKGSCARAERGVRGRGPVATMEDHWL